MFKYLLLVILVLGVIGFVWYKKKPMNDEEMYDSFLKLVKKSFNKILIHVTDIPKIGKKTLVRLDNIDDLVDICEQVKKPIYYIEDSVKKTCDFILLNKDEYCIYTLKVNEFVESLFDKYYLEEQVKSRKENTKILEDLDKTTIIKIDDGSSFKVSPLRDRDLRKIREKEFLEDLKKDVLPKLKEDNKEEVL